MAIALVVPLAWGIATDHPHAGEWISLTAESICWVELKGSYGQRLRTLAGGAFLAFLFALIGSITAPYLWLSVAAMLGVGFISGLFKNLGDRGSGLSICVYVMFIIANAATPKDAHDLQQRMEWVAIGGGWNTLVGMVATAFMPEQQPYRRSIALIWKAISGLIAAVTKGWDGKQVRSSIREVYLKEKEVRAAIDSSLHLYESMAHQVSKKQRKEFELAQLRKATSLVGTHIIAMGEEMEGVDIRSIESGLRLKLYALYKAMQQTVERMAVYVVTLQPEEELLLESRVERLNKLVALLKEYPALGDEELERRISRIIQLTERTIRIIERSIRRLEELGEEKPVFRSYSLLKTLFVLHPKHWWRNLRLLLDFNTFTTRYALRTAVGATFGLFIFKWFRIDHGYWFPFTVILVTQPYFGATFKKAIDRVIGTVLGVIAGSLLLRVPAGLHLKEIMLFVCAIFMVYYIRRRYSVAAFFITLSLVLLFAVGDDLNPTLIFTRVLCTIGGAAVAVLAGFALLPTWDKKLLPGHLAKALSHNYRYFEQTFLPSKEDTSWTRNKRNAETNNSNAFDSFNRYMQEPSIRKKSYALYYQLITHNVRLTRELNNINLEQESRDPDSQEIATAHQSERIQECLRWFNKAALKMQEKSALPDTKLIPLNKAYTGPFRLTMHQQLYLDKMIIELRAMYRDLEKLVQKHE